MRTSMGFLMIYVFFFLELVMLSYPVPWSVAGLAAEIHGWDGNFVGEWSEWVIFFGGMMMDDTRPGKRLHSELEAMAQSK